MKRLDDIVDAIIFGKYSPVEFILNHTVLGGCPHCSAIRAILFGVGIGLGSVTLILVPVGLTLYERYGNAN